MLIGVVSDTHGHLANTARAVRVLSEFPIERVLHCGDIGSAEVVELFTRWQTHFVLGNVDSDARELRRAISAAGLTCHDRFGELEWSQRRIALLHGDDSRRLEETIAGGRYHLVCHGHTHVATEYQRGQTLVLNPGAVYRANPHTVATVDLATMEATRLIV